MPKLKTHKGMKKRFKVSANGKVQHKRCGSSHLMSHKNGKQVRRLRKQTQLNVAAESRRGAPLYAITPMSTRSMSKQPSYRLWQRRPRPRHTLRAPVKRCQLRTERRLELATPTKQLARQRDRSFFLGVALVYQSGIPQEPGATRPPPCLR